MNYQYQVEYQLFEVAIPIVIFSISILVLCWSTNKPKLHAPKNIYIVGSFNEKDALERFAVRLRKLGIVVNTQWLASHQDNDKNLLKYYQTLGVSIKDTVTSTPAKTICNMDVGFMRAADTVIAFAPFGKSATVEACFAEYCLKKQVFVILDPTRVDIMFNLFANLFSTKHEVLNLIQNLIDVENRKWSTRVKNFLLKIGNYVFLQ